jgi:hypothetical protein
VPEHFSEETGITLELEVGSQFVHRDTPSSFVLPVGPEGSSHSVVPFVEVFGLQLVSLALNKDTMGVKVQAGELDVRDWQPKINIHVTDVAPNPIVADDLTVVEGIDVILVLPGCGVGDVLSKRSFITRIGEHVVDPVDVVVVDNNTEIG